MKFYNASKPRVVAPPGGGLWCKQSSENDGRVVEEWKVKLVLGVVFFHITAAAWFGSSRTAQPGGFLGCFFLCVVAAPH